MNFVFDENLEIRLAHAVAALVQGAPHSVQHIDDMGLKGKPDIDVIRALAGLSRACLVTQDRKLTARLHEIAAWTSQGLILAVLRDWSHLQRWERAWRLIRRWPSLVDAAERVGPGTLIDIPANPAHDLKIARLTRPG